MDLWELADLSTPWCLFTAVTLRIAEHIDRGTGDVGGLAAATQSDADSLQRVIRHLVSKGIFEEPAPGRFALNETARGLLEPGARLGLDLDTIGGRMAYVWSTLPQAVKTGKSAYAQVFGRPFWQDLEANPKISADFDALMGPAGHGAPNPEVLLDPAGWEQVRTVADIGGGTGSLLAEVLRARPTVRGILVDLPATVARASETFAAAGVADRVTAVGQSFFEPLPAGADLYLLKSVLSDWADAEVSLLLRRCAEAARPSGRVVVLSGVNPGERAHPDLLMLVLVSGKDRTLAEFRELAREAGLGISASGRLPSGRFAVECRPL